MTDYEEWIDIGPLGFGHVSPSFIMASSSWSKGVALGVRREKGGYC